VMFFSLASHSPFSKGLPGSVLALIIREYTNTNDWITLGVRDLKTLSTTSCKTYWSGLSMRNSKVKRIKFPTYTEAPSKVLSAGILRRQWIASMMFVFSYFYFIAFELRRITFFKQIEHAICICRFSLYLMIYVSNGIVSTNLL
jgi:hypothetical protein